MSIKFNCQHCKRSLKVNQELAGKKVRCPACKKVVSIPTLDPPSADVEEVAAATLADPIVTRAATKEAAPIKFTCNFCDEEVTVPGELAGKQTPCPECRRIVRVPMPVKDQPKDWRTIDRRSAAAAAAMLRDQPAAPEGAWGTAAASLSVSRQALEEADAIPLPVEKVPVTTWIKRGLLGTAALVLAVAGALTILHVRGQSLQRRAIDQALVFAPEKGEAKMHGLEAAEIHRLIGEHYFRANQPEPAFAHYKQAQAECANAKPASLASELLAIKLAIQELDLVGSKQEVQDLIRLPYSAVDGHVRATLGTVVSPEGRAEALRQVSRRLIEKGDLARAKSLVAFVSAPRGDKDSLDLTATIGLELLAAGQKEAAEEQAEAALQPYQIVPMPGEAVQRPVGTPPSLVALLLMLGNEAAVKKSFDLSPPEAGVKNPPLESRVGYAVFWASQGQWDRARALAAAPGPSPDRVKSVLAVARVALEKKSPEDAKKALDTDLKAADRIDPWLQFQLVQLAARVGLAEKARPLADAVSDPSLRLFAQAELERASLEAGGKMDAEAVDAELKKQPVNPIVLEWMARYAARAGNGSGFLKMADSWENENLRPFGYVGVALGLQDSGKE